MVRGRYNLQSSCASLRRMSASAAAPHTTVAIGSESSHTSLGCTAAPSRFGMPQHAQAEVHKPRKYAAELAGQLYLPMAFNLLVHIVCD